ncbi:unnamed protein product [Blumeria hordei]|uniref:Uncharacterized protein n=2 Tax=Blumeria hordei TaxID=2867405 RepID=A0A383UMM3_BLUHO|nr:CSEP0440 putative effector protein [Blumeria hordei DH14]SZF00948.1 unnamed protein product [Blumeria hordei]
MKLFSIFSLILMLFEGKLALFALKTSSVSATVGFKNLIRRGHSTSRLEYRPYSSEFKMNYIAFNCDKRIYLLPYIENVAQVGMQNQANGDQDKGSVKIGLEHSSIFHELYKNEKESEDRPYFIHQIPAIWYEEDEDVVSGPDFVVSAIDGAVMDVITMKEDFNYEKCIPIKSEFQGKPTLITSKSSHFDGWEVYGEDPTS